ncbi:MAG: FtsX-like permease family protein, partial [Verrucomicrobiota bacterium]
TITNYGVMQDYEKIAAEVAEDDAVLGSTPFIIGPVLAECYGKISTPKIKAYDPNATKDEIVPLKQGLIHGEWLTSPESIVVGIEWAKRNQAWIGDRILIHSPRNVALLKTINQPGEVSEEYFLPVEYQIGGIFETGYYDYDFGYLILDIREAQRLYDMHGAAHGLALKIDDPMTAFQVKERLETSLDPSLSVLTWVDLNKTLFAAVQTERRTMSILFFVVMLVAAFALMSTNLTVAVQKTKEFALLLALGGHPAQLLTLVTLYGLIIGMSGCTIGLGLGAFLLSQRDTFSNWMATSFGLDVFPAEIYHFSGIPAVWDWETVGWVVGLGILLSVLSGLVPAIVASRVQPAEALSYG